MIHRQCNVLDICIDYMGICGVGSCPAAWLKKLLGTRWVNNETRWNKTRTLSVDVCLISKKWGWSSSQVSAWLGLLSYCTPLEVDHYEYHSIQWAYAKSLCSPNNTTPHQRQPPPHHERNTAFCAWWGQTLHIESCRFPTSSGPQWQGSMNRMHPKATPFPSFPHNVRLCDKHTLMGGSTVSVTSFLCIPRTGALKEFEDPVSSSCLLQQREFFRSVVLSGRTTWTQYGICYKQVCNIQKSVTL